MTPRVAPTEVRCRLLITGSRLASAEMLRYAQRLVDYANEREWSIVVGDAEGVDAMVIDECLTTGIDYTVYGITPEPRNGPNMHYVRVSGNFLTRDRTMVQHADRVMAIWNGVSRGTKYTYDYAIKRGLKAELRIFEVKK